MARIRSIKPEFFTSEAVSALPLRARLTWIGLWTHCDNHGRARDNGKLIKAAIWPLDDVTLKDIEEDLATLAAHGRIARYSVEGKRYLVVTNWGEHQYGAGKGDPKFPGLDEADSEPSLETSRPSPDKSESDADTSGSNQGSGNQGSGTRTRARATRILDDWQPTADLVAWQRENGISDLLARRELPKFRDYWAAQPGERGRKADWGATWRNWLRTALEREPKPAAPKAAMTEW